MSPSPIVPIHKVPSLSSTSDRMGTAGRAGPGNDAAIAHAGGASGPESPNESMAGLVQSACKDGRATGMDVLQFAICHGKQSSGAGNPDVPALVLADAGNRGKRDLRGVVQSDEAVAGLVEEAAVGAYPKGLVPVFVDGADKSVG